MFLWNFSGIIMYSNYQDLHLILVQYDWVTSSKKEDDEPMGFSEEEGALVADSRDKKDDSDVYSYDDILDNHEPDECCFNCLPKRYMVALLSFLGFVNVYSLRVNLSVALVAMVSNKTRFHPNGTEYVVVSMLFF